MRGDHAVIASGGEGQYLYADSRWPPCAVDRVLDDVGRLLHRLEAQRATPPEAREIPAPPAVPAG